MQLAFWIKNIARWKDSVVAFFVWLIDFGVLVLFSLCGIVRSWSPSLDHHCWMEVSPWAFKDQERGSEGVGVGREWISTER